MPHYILPHLKLDNVLIIKEPTHTKQYAFAAHYEKQRLVLVYERTRNSRAENTASQIEQKVRQRTIKHNKRRF